MMKSTTALAAMVLAAAPLCAQQMSVFEPGTVITDFGQVASVEITSPLPADAQFAVAFDTSTSAEAGEINRTLNSAARFINMHAAAGVPPENIRLAVVVHGQAVFDLVNQERYAGRYEGAQNANVAAIETLLANNVRIIVCGQSAAYYGVGTEELLPGVEMALSAMTAHALLQQEGYTLNPF